MKIRYAVFLCCLISCLFIVNIFADDLKIETGKNLQLGFVNYSGEDKLYRIDSSVRDDSGNPEVETYSYITSDPGWNINNYDKNVVYDNVNIGAASKVDLSNCWEYVLVSSETSVSYDYREITEHTESGSSIESSTKTVKDEIYTTTYTYARRERLATLSVKDDGKIVLNNGSELAIRNQYSLITTTGDSSLKYDADTGHIVAKNVVDDSVVEYVSHDEKGKKSLDGTSVNSILGSQVTCFTGDIVFEVGSTDTILTFKNISKNSVEGEDSEVVVTTETALGTVVVDRLPDRAIGDMTPTATTEIVKTSATITGGDKKYRDVIETEDDAAELINEVAMENNFIINSNRAVFNVEGEKVEEWSEKEGGIKLVGEISGSGVFVKQGNGTLMISESGDATGLTGENTGYGWNLEEGLLFVSAQKHLGASDIYIDQGGTLGLGSSVYTNDITSNSGEISLASGSSSELSGNISGTDTSSTVRFTFVKESALTLSGDNSDIENYVVSFGGKKGGNDNCLISDVEGLATKSIVATNKTKDEETKEYATFDLILKEDNDVEYSGSLQGEMFFRKLGSGNVILSGENTYTKGTYITEGGLLLANSNSIGTSKIMFDGGVRSDSTTYATIGVSSATDVVEMVNDMHIKNGAIFNVYDNQTFDLTGSIVNYDPKEKTEVIKTGLGNVKISGKIDETREINITTFTITNGSFILDNGVVLKSYFNLDGENACLEMNEGSGITNNIDINNGYLSIFNEANILSSVVNFKADTSKLVISSDTYFTTEKFGTNKVHVSTGMEFCILAGTTTANGGVIDFQGGDNTSITKSGEGTFNLDPNNINFNLVDLEVIGGTLKIENSTMTVSNNTVLSGGILKISSTSHYKSSNTEEKKITLLNGAGIGIYDDNSINHDVLLSFEGDDENNLSQLLIEKDNVELSNSIYVEKGLIISNEGLLSFKGDSITGNMGVFGKAGSGTMTIATAGGFEMGELRILDGTMQLETNVNVSTLTISGSSTTVNISSTTSITTNVSNYFSMEDATLNLEENTLMNLNNADITGAKLNLKENTTMKLNMANITGTTINLTSATLNAVGLDIIDSEINLENSKLSLSSSISNVSSDSVYKAPSSNIINLTNTVLHIDTTSVVSATQTNMASSTIYGYGKINSALNVNDDSNIYVGNKDEIAKFETGSIVFGEDSTLYIDVENDSGITSNDVLKVNGNVDVKKGSVLDVNIIGDYDTDYDLKTSFAFMEFSGNLTYSESLYNIFDVNLSSARFSYNFVLDGSNKLVLELSKEFNSYDMPGLTKNQASMQDALNIIYSDPTKREKLKETMQTLDGMYAEYRLTGNRAPFLKALRELSGVNFVNSIMSSALLSKTNMIYTRLNDYTQRKDNNIWAQAYTNSLSVSAVEENPKYENNIYGVIAGYDQQVDDNSVLGISGFYGTGEFKQIDDKADVQDGGVSIYGNYKVSDVDIKGSVGYASQNYDTTRKLTVFGSDIKSNYSVNVYTFDAQADYNYAVSDNFILKPFLGVNCNVVTNGDIEEKGNQQQRLYIKNNTYTKADARIGLRLQSGMDESRFNWYVSILAKQILTGNQFTMKAHFVSLPSDEFEIESTKLNSTAFAGNIGCLYNVSEYVNLFLDLSADTSSNTNSYNGSIGASYRW